MSSDTTGEDYSSVSENIIVSIVVDDYPHSQSGSTGSPDGPSMGYPPGLWGVYKPVRPELVDGEDHLRVPE